MGENMFYVSKRIIPNAAILIVDFEDKYIEDSGSYSRKINNIKKTQRKLKRNFNRISSNIKKLQGQHRLFATFEDSIYDSLKDANITILPNWWDDLYGEKPNEFVDALKDFEYVLVCGLWKELCVYEVTRLLRQFNVNAILLDNDNYTLSGELIGYTTKLEKRLRSHKLEKRLINYNMEYELSGNKVLDIS